MKSDRLNAKEAELWHAWKMAQNAVMARVGRDLLAKTGLSGADFGVLTRLLDLGDGQCRQQDLADSMDWDKSRLSHHLTRMEKRELVRRRPADTRGVVVEILPAGGEAIAKALPVHARAVRRHLLGRIKRTDIDAFGRLCASLAED